MKKSHCPVCPLAHFKNEDTKARRIARAILKDFSLKYAKDHLNYAGLAQCKPCALIELLQKEMEQE